MSVHWLIRFETSWMPSLVPGNNTKNDTATTDLSRYSASKFYIFLDRRKQGKNIEIQEEVRGED